MNYIAIGKKSKAQYEVIGKDLIGTLIKLRTLNGGMTIVSNRCYYDIYDENGTLIAE